MNSTLPGFSAILFASAESSSQVLLVCLAGYLAAKFDLITINIQQDISNLIIKIFMPCFLFSNIFYTITIKRLISLWPIPTFFFFFALISAILGLAGGKLLRLNTSDIKFAITGIIFNNITSLSLGLLKGIENTDAIALLRLDENESPQDTVKRGITYVLLATLWTNLLRWSFGAYLLKKVPEKDDLPIQQPSSSSSNHFQVNDDQSTERTPLLTSNQMSSNNGQITERTPLASSNPTSRVKRLLSFKFMNPPLYAALLALIFVAIPYSKTLFIDKDAPFMAISQAIEYIGSVTIPLTLLILGAQLYSLPRSHNEHIVSIIAYVLTCRFLIMPAIGIFIVLYTRSWYLYDPMLWFVLIMITTGPTAINCINLAQLANNYQEEFAALLFYSYILSVPMVTILVMFILNCIKEHIQL